MNFGRKLTKVDYDAPHTGYPNVTSLEHHIDSEADLPFKHYANHFSAMIKAGLHEMDTDILNDLVLEVEVRHKFPTRQVYLDPLMIPVSTCRFYSDCKDMNVKYQIRRLAATLDHPDYSYARVILGLDNGDYYAGLIIDLTRLSPHEQSHAVVAWDPAITRDPQVLAELESLMCYISPWVREDGTVDFYANL